MNHLINKILYGDCLELMKQIPNHSIDMILCDLPYGTTACKWDVVIPLGQLWLNYLRIIKYNGAIVLTCAQPFTSRLVMSNVEMYKQHLVWHKSIPSNFLNANKMFMKYHEDVIIFYMNLPVFNPQKTQTKKIEVIRNISSCDRSLGVYGKTGEKNNYLANNNGLKNPDSVLFYKNETAFKHPTQKPVALFEYLIKTYTNKHELVLDNCIGSGTTAIACLNTERRFIGMEKDAHYFNVANKRIVDHQLSNLRNGLINISKEWGK